MACWGQAHTLELLFLYLHMICTYPSIYFITPGYLKCLRRKYYVSNWYIVLCRKRCQEDSLMYSTYRNLFKKLCLICSCLFSKLKRNNHVILMKDTFWSSYDRCFSYSALRSPLPFKELESKANLPLKEYFCFSITWSCERNFPKM